MRRKRNRIGDGNTLPMIGGIGKTSEYYAVPNPEYLEGYHQKAELGTDMQTAELGDESQKVELDGGVSTQLGSQQNPAQLDSSYEPVRGRSITPDFRSG
jgi:hypothetical protein